MRPQHVLRRQHKKEKCGHPEARGRETRHSWHHHNDFVIIREDFEYTIRITRKLFILKEDGWGFDPCFMIKVSKIKNLRSRIGRETQKKKEKREREADSERGRKGEKDTQKDKESKAES